MISLAQHSHRRATDQRREELKAFVDSLSRHELTLLSESISDRNDPFNQLPVEIILLILENHPIRDTWRLRQVCRRWRHVLSQDTVVKASLARFDTHREDDSAGPSDRNIEQKIRHMQAIRTGKPFSYIRLDEIPSSSDPMNPETFRSMAALQKHRIAWVREKDQGPREVVVRNLITGQVITAMSDSRECVQFLTLSTTHVGFVTAAGRLHTIRFDDHTHSMSSSRLPSSSIKEMASNGDFLLLLLPADTSPDVRSVLALYNTKTHKLVASEFAHQSVENPPRCLPPMFLLVDARTCHVDIFSAESGGGVTEGEVSYVGHMRFGLSEIGQRGDLQPISRDLILVPRAKSLQRMDWKPFTLMRPTGEDDEFHLVPAVRQYDFDDDQNNRRHPMVLFNRRQCRLRLSHVQDRLADDNYMLHGYIEPRKIVPRFRDQHPLRVPEFNPRGVTWKDTHFTHNLCSDFATFADEPLLREHKNRHTSFVCLNGHWDPVDSEANHSLLTFGNDSFLVAFNFREFESSMQICVYSFEEDVPLAGGQPTRLWDVDITPPNDTGDDCSTDSDDSDGSTGSDDPTPDHRIGQLTRSQLRRLDKRVKCSWLNMHHIERSILRRDHHYPVYG